jgi:signal transduction histidine kinase
MVGNLLGNACKWAKSRVCIATAQADGADTFEVLVDDDGPGLTGPERVNAVKRGQRLDETKPRSGLGLSIVADLAPLYKGASSLSPRRKGACAPGWSCRRPKTLRASSPKSLVKSRLRQFDSKCAPPSGASCVVR